MDASPEAAYTASVVTEASEVMRRVLESHPINRQRAQQGLAPANVVLLRGCGSRMAVETFQQRHG